MALNPWFTTPKKRAPRKPVGVVTQGRFGLDNEARREENRIELTLPIPPTTNNLYANSESGGRFKTKAYSDWIEAAGWRVQQQRPGRIAGHYEIEIEVPRPSHNGRYDLSNRAKALEDLLVKMRVVQDDSLSERIGMSWGPPGSDVRVILSKCERRA